MVGLDRMGLRVVAHQSGVTAEPDPPACIRQHAVDRVARQSLFARHGLEADRVGSRGRSHDPGQTAAARAYPDSIFRVHGQRKHRVVGQRPWVARVVAENLDDGAVGARQIEAAVVRPQPEVAAPVFHHRSDVD